MTPSETDKNMKKRTILIVTTLYWKISEFCIFTQLNYYRIIQQYYWAIIKLQKIAIKPKDQHGSKMSSTIFTYRYLKTFSYVRFSEMHRIRRVGQDAVPDVC